MNAWAASMLLVGAAACGKPAGNLRGKVVATDHYEETAGLAKRVGDLRVTLDATGAGDAAVTIGFAAPPADWGDPRPVHFLEPPPQALVALAGCRLRVTRGDAFAAVEPEQRCGDVRITRGRVWVDHHVLQIELYGDVAGAHGGAYRLVFPILMGSDYAIPIH